jgi:uncharacterized lipoprotein NlpE involved in copper resistance
MFKNNVFHFILIVLLLTAAISACVSTQPTDMSHNAKDSLDWEGRYAGRIPSASGSGIDVQITLRSDLTFSMVYDYVDREGSFTENGTFIWDETGNVIILNHPSFPPYYRVEKDQLRQLDLERNEITGNLADMYVLRKVK